MIAMVNCEEAITNLLHMFVVVTRQTQNYYTVPITHAGMLVWLPQACLH